MINLIVPVLALLSTVACAASRAPLDGAAADEMNVLLAIHKQDWAHVGIADIAGIVPWRLSPEGESQTDDGHCQEQYYSSLTPRGGHTWLRLSPLLSADMCSYRLSPVSYWRDFRDRADAEAVRAAVIGTLRAGGVPSLHDHRQDFIWRSIDSRRYYNLYTDVFSQGSLYRVSVRILQTPSTPKEVDMLPFEAGFTPP